MQLRDDRERAIWAAAYAAAWVSDFRATRGHGNSFEHAIGQNHAEVAIQIADAAVDQLREYTAPFVVVHAPGDRCGNTKRLPDGTPCPGCRACS